MEVREVVVVVLVELDEGASAVARAAPRARDAPALHIFLLAGGLAPLARDLRLEGQGGGGRNPRRPPKRPHRQGVLTSP